MQLHKKGAVAELSPARPRRFLLSTALLLIFFALGAVMRFWFAASWYRAYKPPEEGYYEAGIGLLSAHVFSVGLPNTDPHSWRGPVYPVFIALGESLFRVPSPGHIRLFQAALSSWEIFAVFALSQAALSPAAGVLAAAWLALQPAQIEWTSSLNIPNHYSVWILIVALAVLGWIRRRGDDGSSAVLGFLFGASLLCRSSHFLLLPLLSLAAVIWWGAGRRAVRSIQFSPSRPP